MAESNKQLKSKIEQVEKELNENKKNTDKLKEQAENALAEKGQHEQQRGSWHGSRPGGQNPRIDGAPDPGHTLLLLLL